VEILVCEVFILKEKIVNKLLILCEENKKNLILTPLFPIQALRNPLTLLISQNYPSISTPGMIILYLRGLN
jgi:hypothetical protein